MECVLTGSSRSTSNNGDIKCYGTVHKNNRRYLALYAVGPDAATNAKFLSRVLTASIRPLPGLTWSLLFSPRLWTACDIASYRGSPMGEKHPILHPVVLRILRGSARHGDVVLCVRTTNWVHPPPPPPPLVCGSVFLCPPSYVVMRRRYRKVFR